MRARQLGSRRVGGRGRAAIVAAAIGVAGGSSIPSAHALPTDISTAPTTGPAGTTVTMTGSACQANLLLPARVNVLAPTLALNVDVTPSASGVWSVQFDVPHDALALPHVITASCIVAGLVPVPYLPQTFTVDGPPLSTTTSLATTTSAVVAPDTTRLSTTVTSTIAAGLGVASGPSADPMLDPALVTPPPGIAATTATTATTGRATTSTGSTSSPPTGGAASAASPDARISAARSGDGSVLFGAGDEQRGWLDWLIWVLLTIVITSGVVAGAWFAWLRKTRARLWWERWLHQMARVRGLGRP